MSAGLALAPLFALHGIPAVHAAAGEAPTQTAVLALYSAGDRSADYRGLPAAGPLAATRVAEVLVSALPAVAAGDTLTLAGSTYTITAASRHDPDRLVWTLELAA